VHEDCYVSKLYQQTTTSFEEAQPSQPPEWCCCNSPAVLSRATARLAFEHRHCHHLMPHRALMPWFRQLLRSASLSPKRLIEVSGLEDLPRSALVEQDEELTSVPLSFEARTGFAEAVSATPCAFTFAHRARCVAELLSLRRIA
jgi:hypothetical protein